MITWIPKGLILLINPNFWEASINWVRMSMKTKALSRSHDWVSQRLMPTAVWTIRELLEVSDSDQSLLWNPSNFRLWNSTVKVRVKTRLLQQPRDWNTPTSLSITKITKKSEAWFKPKTACLKLLLYLRSESHVWSTITVPFLMSRRSLFLHLGAIMGRRFLAPLRCSILIGKYGELWRNRQSLRTYSAAQSDKAIKLFNSFRAANRTWDTKRTWSTLSEAQIRTSTHWSQSMNLTSRT